MKNYRLVAACGLFILIGLVTGDPRNTTNGQSGKPPYKNPSLPIEKRVDDLVSRMTLEEKVSQMMNGAAAIERLDIPEYEWWNEALHGVARAGHATVFPQAIGLAATWNTDNHIRLPGFAHGIVVQHSSAAGWSPPRAASSEN